MITLDGSYGWAISYTNKHNLSGTIVEEINKGDWTFCTSIKPEWNPDKLTLNVDETISDELARNKYYDKAYRGGIVVRNGMHSGIFCVLWPFDNGSGYGKYVKGEIWYETPAGEIKIAILEERIFGDDWIDIVISYNRSKKFITLYTKELNQKWKVKEMEINGEIIDYTGSHVWIGCSNGFDVSPEPEKQFYSGSIRSLGVFNKALNEKDRDKFYNEFNEFCEISKYFSSNIYERLVHIFEKMNPLAFTNFKTTTPYKAFDFSGNGNHPIIYKEEWGVY